MKEKIKLFFKDIWSYLKNLINISEDTDSVATIENITKGVEFKGDNIWVLFFAIIIASVGLNVNSTAVIIGAMLVSPLMGPIMGLGLSIGINDTELLRKSLKNLAIMILISLIASSAYFLISPLSDAQSELLARTRPTIYDVFIAFAGGLAGILASSRKQEKITVVSGVAIATALMPPLCTAGYGLGTGQFMYFFGAFYLFFINTFFIALATFIMVRYLRFPKRKYMDPVRERRVKRTIMIVTIIILVPSILIALGVVKETSFNSAAIRYVSDIQDNPIMKNVQVVSQERNYSRKGSEIILSLVGQELDAEQISILQKRMEELGLHNTKLIIKQAKGGILDIETQAKMLQNFIEDKDKVIAEKDNAILVLKKQIDIEKDKAKLTTEQLASEVSVLYPEVSQISMSMAVKVNIKSKKSDTIPTLNVKWEKDIPSLDTCDLLKRWLLVRLKTDKIDIVNVR